MSSCSSGSLLFLQYPFLLLLHPSKQMIRFDTEMTPCVTLFSRNILSVLILSFQEALFKGRPVLSVLILSFQEALFKGNGCYEEYLELDTC
jgi:hypothetical protein